MDRLIKYNSKFGRLWDALLILSTIVSVYLITYQAFFVRERFVLAEIIIYSLDFFFVISMWVVSHTTYRVLGAEVVDSSSISKRYFKNSFKWDLLGVFPFELFALLFLNGDIALKSVLLFRLIRLVRIRYIFIIYKKWEGENWTNSAMIRISRLITLLILLSHLIACSWFYSSHLANYPDDSWVVREELSEEIPSAQYLRSIYWSITSMTTVGYGDIVPKRSIEYILSIIVMAIGASSYAFIIGNIASLFSNLDISKTRHQYKTDSVFNFLKARSVNPNLISRVNNYYEYIWEKRKGLDESQLFNDLPDSLKLDLLKDLLSDQLDHLPLFKESSGTIKNELLKSLRLQIYSPEDIVASEGEPGNAVFFISNGTVSVVDRAGTEHDQLEAGDYFGDLSLMLQESRTATVKCLEFSEIFILPKIEFNRIKNDYPEFTEVLKSVSKNRSEKAIGLLLKDIIL